MSEPQENTTNWKALACKGGYAVIAIYILSMLGIATIKFFTGYDYMFYNFLAGIVATVTILVGANMLNATESKSEKRRQLVGRIMSYHIIGLLGILLLPFDRAPGLSSITILVLLGLVFFGQAWMTDQEQETEAIKLFKSAWKHAGTALPILVVLILIVGLWSTWGLGAQTESVWKSIPAAFEKLETLRKEKLAQEAERDASVRGQRRDLLPFLGRGTNGSPVHMAQPVEGEYLDGAGTMTIVTESGQSNVYKMEQQAPSQTSGVQPAPPVATSRNGQYALEILGIQEPLRFLNATELESFATGEVSSEHMHLSIIAPTGAQNLVLSGRGNGSSFSGTWQQGGVSGTFAAQMNGRLQVDLYSGNIRVAVIMIAM